MQLVLDTIPAAVFWKYCDLRLLGYNDQVAVDAGLFKHTPVVGKSDADMPWRPEDATFIEIAFYPAIRPITVKKIRIRTASISGTVVAGKNYQSLLVELELLKQGDNLSYIAVEPTDHARKGGSRMRFMAVMLRLRFAVRCFLAETFFVRSFRIFWHVEIDVRDGVWQEKKE